MGNIWNWLLVITGGLMVIAELLMGAVTGFDLALMGLAIGIGGGIGLATGSAKVGLASSAALGVLYLLLFRRWVKSKLDSPEKPSNVDAIVGLSGVVTVRIAPHEAGQVKLGDETWRAVLASADGAALEAGAQVRVEAVDGVTLKVR